MEGISFIFFSSNNASTIERSIKSAIQALPSDFEHISVTVFDKTSVDGTAGILKNFPKTSHLSVVFDRPEGLRIRDLFTDDQAEFIFVLDADVIMEEGCIANLVSALEKPANIMLAGAKVRLLNHTLKRAGRVHEVLTGKNPGRKMIRHTYKHLPDTLPLAQIASEPEIIKTMCYALRNKDFHDLFPDDALLSELTLKELCSRIRQKDGKIRYQPDAAVVKMNELVPPGFMFTVTSPEHESDDIIPGLDGEMEQIRKDLDAALAENRIREVFSTGNSGFREHFQFENIHGKILSDRINISGIKGDGRIIFPRLSYRGYTDLIVKAEVESKEMTTILLKYKTKSDPAFSDKKSYSSEIFPGRQLVLFSFVTGHLTGELCFELTGLEQDFTIYSIKVYCYENASAKKSLVSVVIPCYNQGEFLDDALDSLKDIDREKYEVIIVNDGSTDPATLDKFRELESKGWFVHHQGNKGLVSARNEGIRLAKGNYILPLDSDNKIRPVYIDQGIELLDMHPETGVVYSDVQRFGDSDKVVIVPEFDPKTLLMKNTIDACALFRKEIWEQVGGYDNNMVQGYEDWAFWMDIAASGNWRFLHLDQIAFDYRVNNVSMVSNTKLYHYKLLDYMLSKNISFFRREFQKIYKKEYNREGTSQIKILSGHETLIGCFRVHLRHFIDNLLKSKIPH